MVKTSFWNKKIIVSYILSVLVFWDHCSTFENYDSNAVLRFVSSLFSHSIGRIAVPLFFIIAGVAFYRDYTDGKYVDKLKSRIRSLVIPFLLWNIINMAFEIVASTFFSQYFVGREKIVLTLPNIMFGIFHYQYNRPFWFILFLLSLHR